jgi:hypothetical protein
VSRGKGKRHRKNTRLRKKKQIYIGGATVITGLKEALMRPNPNKDNSSQPRLIDLILLRDDYIDQLLSNLKATLNLNIKSDTSDTPSKFSYNDLRDALKKILDFDEFLTDYKNNVFSTQSEKTYGKGSTTTTVIKVSSNSFIFTYNGDQTKIRVSQTIISTVSTPAHDSDYTQREQIRNLMFGLFIIYKYKQIRFTKSVNDYYVDEEFNKPWMVGEFTPERKLGEEFVKEVLEKFKLYLESDICPELKEIFKLLLEPFKGQTKGKIFSDIEGKKPEEIIDDLFEDDEKLKDLMEGGLAKSIKDKFNNIKKESLIKNPTSLNWLNTLKRMKSIYLFNIYFEKLLFECKKLVNNNVKLQNKIDTNLDTLNNINDICLDLLYEDSEGGYKDIIESIKKLKHGISFGIFSSPQDGGGTSTKTENDYTVLMAGVVPSFILGFSVLYTTLELKIPVAAFLASNPAGWAILGIAGTICFFSFMKRRWIKGQKEGENFFLDWRGMYFDRKKRLRSKSHQNKIQQEKEEKERIEHSRKQWYKNYLGPKSRLFGKLRPIPKDSRQIGDFFSKRLDILKKRLKASIQDISFGPKVHKGTKELFRKNEEEEKPTYVPPPDYSETNPSIVSFWYM